MKVRILKSSRLYFKLLTSLGQNEVERPQIETSSETLTREDDLKTKVDNSSPNFGQTHSSSFVSIR